MGGRAEGESFRKRRNNWHKRGYEIGEEYGADMLALAARNEKNAVIYVSDPAKYQIIVEELVSQRLSKRVTPVLTLHRRRYGQKLG